MTSEAKTWSRASRAVSDSCKHATQRRRRSASSAWRFRPHGPSVSGGAELASTACSSPLRFIAATSTPTRRTPDGGPAGAAADRGSFFEFPFPRPTEEQRIKTLFLAAKFSEGGMSVKGGSSVAKWHIRDIALLRLHYATTPGVTMARMLGRSVGSVQQQARKLGLRRTNGHESTPAMRAAGRLRRGRPFTEKHLAALKAAKQRGRNNEVQLT